MQDHKNPKKGFLPLLTNFFQVEIPPSDLGPGSSVQETLTLLREVLSSHDAAITPLEERQKDYEKVLLALGSVAMVCHDFTNWLNNID